MFVIGICQECIKIYLDMLKMDSCDWGARFKKKKGGGLT